MMQNILFNMRNTILILAMLSFFQSNAQLSVAKIFTDHAVLQRDKPLNIWGWAKAGTSVSVQLNSVTKTGKTNSEGKWSITFPAFDAGGPYTMKVQAEKTVLELKDIYIGEVWLCSGQSNMEWPLSLANNAITEVKRARDPKIRHIKLECDLSLTPKDDLIQPRTNWTVCSPKTSADFTAVGYFFARQLREQLGEDVAIGLVNSSWGGSQVESWISKEGMAATDALKSYANNFPKSWEECDLILKNRVLKHCFGERMQPDSAHQESLYTQPGFDFTTWPVGSAPLAWDWQGIWAFRGTGYMARKVEVAEFLVDAPAKIYLGESDFPVKVWVNGQPMEVDTTNHKITATVPVGVFKTGKNDLLVYIGAQKEPNWWGMGLHGAPKDLYIQWPDFTIPIDGGNWHIIPSWNTPHTFARSQNNAGAILYNAMIHPLVPMAMRGVLWYQGENNAERAYQYRASFPAMIQDWRQAWGDEFPFLFVQLSSFGSDVSANEGSNWAELREAQEKALELPNTSMAITLDIGDAADIHPRNKQDVGKRLALAALNTVYNKDIPYQNPRLLAVTWEAASAVLNFENAGTGLVARDKYGYIKGFEVAAADQKFYYAKAEFLNDRQILVTHPEGLKPVSVRYAWSDAPVDANVFNSFGLPLGTFRTDNWKGKTEGKKFE
jgi:sialate O-acetylesterase